jgi:hypothetical protein
MVALLRPETIESVGVALPATGSIIKDKVLALSVCQ